MNTKRNGFGLKKPASSSLMRGVATGAIAGAVAFGVAQCSTPHHSEKPTTTTTVQYVDVRNSVKVIKLPDEFSNVATVCDGTTRLYVTDKGDANNRAALAVVPHDERCMGK